MTTKKERGFTLIELLVVMLIITIVIAITLPALGLVRDLSRKTATNGLMQQLNTATSQFQTDNRRLPGYFTARDMGDTQNLTQGFSAAQNMLLDLIGGDAVSTQAGANRVQVGPKNVGKVYVDVQGLGAGAAAGKYAQISGKYLAAQTAAGAQVGDANNVQMPTIVDAWGMPLLVWSKDEQTIGQVGSADDFASVTYNNNQPARYYWASNAAFLQATAAGAKGINQDDAAKGSILAENVSANGRRNSLIGLLGSPSALRSEDTASGYQQMLPSAPRGSLVLHSAGSNGVFMGRTERGAKTLPDGLTLWYGLNFKTAQNQPHLDSNNKPTSVDVRDGFDDLLVVGGN